MKQLFAKPFLSFTFFILSFILMYFLYQLLFGAYSFGEIEKLKANHQQQILKNEKQLKNNNNLKLELESLTNDKDALESYARQELGLIKEGEIIIEIKNE
jgi:cell division protein FtsB